MEPKVHYFFHKCLPPVPILRQIDSVHAPTCHFLKIRLNSILSSMPWSSKWSFPLRFPHLNPVYTSAPPYVLHGPPILLFSFFITRTILGEECRLLSPSLCSFRHSLLTSSYLGSNILLSTLFSNTFGLFSSFSLNDQVSHSYKTTWKIIVLYIWIFVFLDSNLEDKRFCTEW